MARAALTAAIAALAFLLLANAPKAECKPLTRGERNDPRRIHYSSLGTLYFKEGMQTWARRGKQYKQLQCVGNSKHICDTYAPDVVVCKHMGDGAWRCEADLHRSVRMGSVDVSCEGWDGPDDEFIMRGSCFLKYKLLPAYKDPYDDGHTYQQDRNSLGLIFIIAVFILILWFNNRGQRGIAQGAGGPGGGGGGGGGWFSGWGGGPAGHPGDAPPPYRPMPKTEYGTSAQAPPQQQGWRPGFWTGLGAGALAGEAARFLRGDNAGARRYAAPPRSSAAPQPRYFDRDSDDDSPFARGSGGRNTFGNAGSSSDTHTSFGFGGTTVR